jgi:uncharacterized membrane protein (DUF485 family)
MNEINRQVRQARRRLNFHRFMHVFGWALFIGLMVAVIGLAIPKIWYLSFLNTPEASDFWTAGWLIGGGVISLILAAVFTYRARQTSDNVAIEIDKRFGLKERLSSAMTLGSEDRESDAGKALLHDAEDRAQTIDVRDKFRFQPDRRLALPLIPILLLIGIAFLPNAIPEITPEALAEKRDKQQVEVAIKEMQKKIDKQKKALTEKGLDDAMENLNSLQRKLDDLDPEKLPNKKDALVKLNDIKKEIEDRQRELGDSKALKESLNKLKDVGEGPAQKIAEAMSKGDMKEAQKAIKDLADKLKLGKMSEAEKKKLAKELNEIANQLKKIAEQHQAKKEELKKQLEKATKQGDLDKAAELQQKIDEMEKQEKQMQKMKKMGQNLKKCANCMKPGGKQGAKKQGEGGEKQPSQGGENGQQQMDEAAQALEDLEQIMKEMGDELEELENLEDLEEAIGDCKGCMNGQQDSDKPPKWQDWAQGSGRGAGKRDRQEEETGNYKDRVKAKLQKGQTVVTGDADGNNISGRSASEVRELVKDSMSKENDPLENTVLPKAAREHAHEYFEKVREGN